MVTIECPDIEGFEQEAGGHRIQRVPATERRGRVHSSTVTVSVLIGVVKINDVYDRRGRDDFHYRWFSGTGKGGQNRNKVQACLELTHKLTGLSVTIQGRSRTANEREATASLLSKLGAARASLGHQGTNTIRSSQIGTGERADKIRTLRFQADEVVDHRTGKRCTCRQFMSGDIERLWVK